MITELTSDSQSVSDAGASEHPVISLGSDQTILVKSSDAAAGAGHHNKGAVSLTPLSLSSLDVSGSQASLTRTGSPSALLLAVACCSDCAGQVVRDV